MGDGITFKMVTGPFTAAIKQREARMPAAARYAVREAGRVTKKAARAKAPVLRDKTVTSAAVNRGARFRKAGGIGPVPSAATGPVSGLLRASITPSKQLTSMGDSAFSLKVGPRGERVHLYAQKIEARVGYMAAGEAAAKAALPSIADTAFNRVWRGA